MSPVYTLGEGEGVMEGNWNEMELNGTELKVFPLLRTPDGSTKAKWVQDSAPVVPEGETPGAALSFHRPHLREE